MIYGFNDSKEKVEVVAEDRFAKIEDTSTFEVAAGETVYRKFPALVMQQVFNDTDLDKWSVIVNDIYISDSYHNRWQQNWNVTHWRNGQEFVIPVENTGSSTMNVKTRVVFYRVEPR